MVDKKVAQRKLRKLRQYLYELSTFKIISWEEYMKNFQHQRAVERLIQLIVDVAADINTHAVVDAGNPSPRDSYDSFIQAAKLGMFPPEFARKIAPSTGERNIIVHEYEQIDDGIVYESIVDTLVMYKQYYEYVLRFVEEEQNESTSQTEM